jgi:hypothetical protein
LEIFSQLLSTSFSWSLNTVLLVGLCNYYSNHLCLWFISVRDYLYIIHNSHKTYAR